MSSAKPTSLIIAAIDRSVDSTPRPPVWLRSLVGAALAVPCLIGLVLAMGVKPTAPLVAKSDQFASLQLENDAPSGSMGAIADVSPTGPSASSLAGFAEKSRVEPPVAVAEPAAVAEPEPPVSVGATTSSETIDDIFGIDIPPPPQPSVPEQPQTVSEATEPAASGSTDAPAGGLAGLDIPGYPSTPVSGSAETPNAPNTPAAGVAMGPEGVPVPGVATSSPPSTSATGSARPSPDLAGIPAPSTPDDVPAPSSSGGEVTDLRQLMRDIRKEVTEELEEKFPMYQVDDQVTLKLINGQTVTGKIVFLQTSFIMLSSQGERPKIQYSRLHPPSRIRCDQAFRDAQISAETEKRVLDALK